MTWLDFLKTKRDKRREEKREEEREKTLFHETWQKN